MGRKTKRNLKLLLNSILEQHGDGVVELECLKERSQVEYVKPAAENRSTEL